jgi:hypothetical protein
VVALEKSLATCFVYRRTEVHGYWQYFSRVIGQHSHLSHFVSVCVILLNLCVLVCACIRAGLLIGPALLIMHIN